MPPSTADVAFDRLAPENLFVLKAADGSVSQSPSTGGGSGDKAMKCTEVTPVLLAIYDGKDNTQKSKYYN